MNIQPLNFQVQYSLFLLRSLPILKEISGILVAKCLTMFPSWFLTVSACVLVLSRKCTPGFLVIFHEKQLPAATKKVDKSVVKMNLNELDS